MVTEFIFLSVTFVSSPNETNRIVVETTDNGKPCLIVYSLDVLQLPEANLGYIDDYLLGMWELETI